MKKVKQVIGGPYISRGRTLSISKAVRAGDFVFLTGVLPRIGDQPMTEGTIEDQTHCVCQTIKDVLAEAGCELSDVSFKSSSPNIWVTRYLAGVM